MMYKNILTKTMSALTIAAVILVLSGVFYILEVPGAYATNDTSVADLSGTESDPRIAADGESELAVLGLNLLRENSDDTIELNSVKVRLTSEDTASEAAVSNIETVRLYRDSTLAGFNGVFDENDALLKEVTRTKTGAFTATVVNNANAASGKNQIDVTSVANAPTNGATVYVKVGTGETAEILQGTYRNDDAAAGDACSSGAGSNTCIAFGATTTGFDHSNNDAVREVNDLISTGNGDGFIAWDSTEIIAELGDPGNTLASGDTGFSIPKSDLGHFAGNDVFVVLETADGAVDQTIKAQVFESGDIEYLNNTAGSTITPSIIGAGTTSDGQTKTLTFGPDEEAPEITKVETYDNSADGIVDRIKVYFSEQMASDVSGTQNFVNALGGTSSRIEAGATDITLAADGSWSTTDVLNDTLTIDFQSTSYSNSTRSTGDSWTIKYDKDKTTDDQLKDASGRALEDASITTTDKARPYLISAKVKDESKNLRADTLEVTFSESLDTANTTTSGLVLKETALGSSTYTYELESIAGYEKSNSADANSNDTIVISLTERGSDDVTGTFTLDYRAGATVLDIAGNEAFTRTGLSATADIAPIVTRAEFQDNCDGVDGNFDCSTSGANGKIDTVKITFSRAVDTDYTAGGAVSDWTIGGYSNPGIATANADPVGANATDGVTTLYLRFDEKTFDTGEVPDLTYSKASGDSANVCYDNADNDCQPSTDGDIALASVLSADVAEEDKAAPYARSATLYDTNSDSIWDAGETLQVLFSEPVDPSSLASSWSDDSFTDWTFSGGAGVTPDAGTVSASGKVVIFTPSETADGSFTGNITPKQNELKDEAGNSVSNSSVTVSVNPTTPPGVERIETRDLNKNGIVDALLVEFSGLIDASTLEEEDWAAIRGSSYSTSAEESPDLQITSVETESGGNDTRVLVKFDEANEDTAALPKVKYVQGSLEDLAGNEVESFNQGSDDAKFSTSLDTNTSDGAEPQLMLKRLADRDQNGTIDQLVLVFSEAMDTGTTSSAGLSAGSEQLASTGAWSSNSGEYDAYTFASLDNVFKIDISETDASEFMPSVEYASTGAFKDAAGLPLASVAGGGEESEVNFAPAPDMDKFADGDLVRLPGTEDVYIYKKAGERHFKRLILNPDIFNSYGHLEWANVREDVTQAEMDMMETSDLILELGGEKVYRVSSDAGADTGEKQHIDMSPNNFVSCGYEWDAIYTVNSTEVSDDFYPEGEAIDSC